MPDISEGAPRVQKSGMIFNIQRASTEDGPGIRTTVFFKGCNLRCAWCHNPEGIDSRPQLQWVKSLCMGCHACLGACSRQALAAGTAGIAIDRDRCDACGACAAVCPTGAIEIIGRPWSVAQLVEEVARDTVYFGISGGGMTASGGEPALQAGFLAEVFGQCRARGVSTALDTGGQAPVENYERLLPHTDMVLFDVKLIDPQRHHRHTGRDNRLILENLVRIAQHKRHGWPGRIWIRTPIIPGATDDEDNIAGIGRFLATHLDADVACWQLCAFNNLCRDKYRRLGLNWAYQGADLISAERMERLCDAARRSGVTRTIVAGSGATRRPRQNR